MKKRAVEESASEYEEWYDQHPVVFRSEVEAIKAMLPSGEGLRGIEIGTRTGKFSAALGLQHGVEPSALMRKRALERGLNVMEATADNLPYGDLRFDFVVMNFCNYYYPTLFSSFREAFRVLKDNGVLVIGFIDRDHAVKRVSGQKSRDLLSANCEAYSPHKVLFELSEAGFRQVEVAQTLFNAYDNYENDHEPVKPGFGEGSFIVMKARKKKRLKASA
jgi:SAM-dependent methyltransferase